MILPPSRELKLLLDKDVQAIQAEAAIAEMVKKHRPVIELAGSLVVAYARSAEDRTAARRPSPNDEAMDPLENPRQTPWRPCEPDGTADRVERALFAYGYGVPGGSRIHLEERRTRPHPLDPELPLTGQITVAWIGASVMFSSPGRTMPANGVAMYPGHDLLAQPPAASPAQLANLNDTLLWFGEQYSRR